MQATLVTWNLKGSAAPDISGVVAHLRATGADLVALQEVQWHQARAIARALGARGHRWGFKHWPVRTWPEGMAVIGVTAPVHVRTRALSHRWRLWSWRRRIVQVATVGEHGAAFTLVNVHLTPHGQVELRAVETSTVLAVAAGGTGPVVVAGDLNERPAGDVHTLLAAAGLRDAWRVRHGDEAPGAVPSGEPPPDRGATNWKGWRSGTGRAPSQRLDYVYVSASIDVVDVRTPDPDDEGFAAFARLSDHLPVTAVLAVTTPVASSSGETGRPAPGS